MSKFKIKLPSSKTDSSAESSKPTQEIIRDAYEAPLRDESYKDFIDLNYDSDGQPKLLSEAKQLELLKNDAIKRTLGKRQPKKIGSNSRTTLEGLGFDPLEEMVDLYDEISLMLVMERNKKRPSKLALTALINSKQKCAADLIRYGYARVSETQIIEQKDTQPLSIMLDSSVVSQDELDAVDKAIDAEVNKALKREEMH